MKIISLTVISLLALLSYSLAIKISPPADSPPPVMSRKNTNAKLAPLPKSTMLQ